jgi:hypothetical protein
VRVQRLLGHVALTLAYLCVAAPIDAQTITVFDVPGSTATHPTTISPAGMVAGSYLDVTGAEHGFIRDTNGHITTFDAPASIGTRAFGFGHAGSVFGAYMDGNAAVHGYIRESDGTITTFDVPGALSTFPISINDAGEIAGTYEAEQGSHGFVRDVDGHFSSFLENVNAVSINNRGDVVGSFFDANRSRCFIRDHKGDITIFDVGDLASSALGINSGGLIVGEYSARPGDLLRVHGFILDTNGNITTFDPPNAFFTTPVSINASGSVTGFYSASSTGKFPFGFVRDASGNIRTFRGPGFSNDTRPSAINARGQITGSYIDPVLQVSRGFIRSN